MFVTVYVQWTFSSVPITGKWGRGMQYMGLMWMETALPEHNPTLNVFLHGLSFQTHQGQSRHKSEILCLHLLVFPCNDISHTDADSSFATWNKNKHTQKKRPQNDDSDLIISAECQRMISNTLWVWLLWVKQDSAVTRCFLSCGSEIFSHQITNQTFVANHYGCKNYTF